MMDETAPKEGRESPANPNYRLMEVISFRLGENRRPGSGRPFAGFLAAVRSGLTQAGDVQAHIVCAPFTGGLSVERARAARRAAAIRAVHKDVVDPRFDGQSETSRRWLSVGQSLSHLYRAENGTYPGEVQGSGDQIIDQVGLLPLLDLDEAALILHNLIGRCAGASYPGEGGARRPVGVDFRSLTRTLLYWGDGISAESNNHRNQLVADFYGVRD